jgi:hypothetical protein
MPDFWGRRGASSGAQAAEQPDEEPQKKGLAGLLANRKALIVLGAAVFIIVAVGILFFLRSRGGKGEMAATPTMASTTAPASKPAVAPVPSAARARAEEASPSRGNELLREVDSLIASGKLPEARRKLFVAWELYGLTPSPATWDRYPRIYNAARRTGDNATARNALSEAGQFCERMSDEVASSARVWVEEREAEQTQAFQAGLR